MKKLIESSLSITLFDVLQSMQNGWTVSTYKRRLYLENEKTIFLPNRMPKP